MQLLALRLVCSPAHPVSLCAPLLIPYPCVQADRDERRSNNLHFSEFCDRLRRTYADHPENTNEPHPLAHPLGRSRQPSLAQMEPCLESSLPQPDQPGRDTRWCRPPGWRRRLEAKASQTYWQKLVHQARRGSVTQFLVVLLILVNYVLKHDAISGVPSPSNAVYAI